MLRVINERKMSSQSNLWLVGLQFYRSCYIKHLMTGAKGNSEFCFLKTLHCICSPIPLTGYELEISIA